MGLWDSLVEGVINTTVDIGNKLDKKRKVSSGFTRPTTTYIRVLGNNGKAQSQYYNGINRVLSNIRNNPEFADLTDSDLRTIARGAAHAGNAETHFMRKSWTKPGGTKDRLNKKIQSGTASSGSILARVNKALSSLFAGEFTKAYDIWTAKPYTGDLNSYYKGNAMTVDNAHKLRASQLVSGPSVGVSQMKGAKYIVPEFYQDKAAPSYEQDGINTAYALAKAYQTLKNKKLYYTKSALTKEQQKAFATNPEKVKIIKGDEIPIMAKLALYWNQGGVPSSSTGQTGLTNYKRINGKRPANYSGYPAAWGVATYSQ